MDPHRPTAAPAPHRLTVTRTGDTTLAVQRTIAGAPAAVFEAFAQPALFQRWWVPASSGLALLSCELDVRTGGHYRLVFRHPAATEPMAFHGRYLEVLAPTRLVWTNDEAHGNGTVTTVTLHDHHGQTLLTVDERYPSKDALEAELAGGGPSWNDEAFDQLDALLRSPSAPAVPT